MKQKLKYKEFLYLMLSRQSRIYELVAIWIIRDILEGEEGFDTVLHRLFQHFET